MTYLLTVRKEAEFDISKTFDFYEEHRLGLGHDFILCVDAALSKIERNPLLYSVNRAVNRATHKLKTKNQLKRQFYSKKKSKKQIKLRNQANI